MINFESRNITEVRVEKKNKDSSKEEKREGESEVIA